MLMRFCWSWWFLHVLLGCLLFPGPVSASCYILTGTIMGCLPPWSSTLLISATNFSSLSLLMRLLNASLEKLQVVYNSGCCHSSLTVEEGME